MEIGINDVIVGQRYRRELGDIDALAQSISDVGLLHPIVITPDKRLICGARRLEAHRRLGLAYIEATVLDLGDIAQGEFAENEIRKDFTWSERCEIAAALEPGERAKAEANSQFAGRPKMGENFTPISDGSTRLDRVAQAIGVSRPTLTKAREIYDSGDEGLIAEMDRTGKVDGLYRRMKMDDIKPPPSIPTGQYRVIYADPPWRFDNSGFAQSAAAIYPTMSTKDICQLAVSRLAAESGAVLFLWATNAMLVDAFDVMTAWGFEYKTNLVWCKERAPGMGWYTQSKHEILLLGTCHETIHPNEKPDSWQRFGAAGHSAKPAEWRSLIMRMYEGPYIELFARTKIEGWEVWGNEIP